MTGNIPLLRAMQPSRRSEMLLPTDPMKTFQNPPRKSPSKLLPANNNENLAPETLTAQATCLERPCPPPPTSPPPHSQANQTWREASVAPASIFKFGGQQDQQLANQSEKRSATLWPGANSSTSDWIAPRVSRREDQSQPRLDRSQQIVTVNLHVFHVLTHCAVTQ